MSIQSNGKQLMGKSYRVGAELPILMRNSVGLGAGDIDDAVDDCMRHMDSLRAELAGKRLGQSAQSKLGGSKRSEIGRALDARCGAGEDQGGRVGRCAFGLEKQGQSALGKSERARSVYIFGQNIW